MPQKWPFTDDESRHRNGFSLHYKGKWLRLIYELHSSTIKSFNNVSVPTNNVFSVLYLLIVETVRTILRKNTNTFLGSIRNILRFFDVNSKSYSRVIWKAYEYLLPRFLYLIYSNLPTYSPLPLHHHNSNLLNYEQNKKTPSE